MKKNNACKRELRTAVLIKILHLLFALFLIYTWAYILQWIIGLCISIYRLAEASQRKRRVRWILPDPLAMENSVSVIIPAHNEEACVVDTIESLLNEDYPNLEIILVDDGSTDHTAQRVIDQYGLVPSPGLQAEVSHRARGIACYEQSLRSRRLILLRKENGGKAESLNCGLDLCSGRYCVILDADTRIEKGSLRIMVSQFLADRQTIVCAGAVGNNETMYKELPLLRKCLVLFQTLEYYRTFYMQRILLDRVNANIVVSGAFAMFDCALLKAIGGYQENTIGEDMELTMRLHAFCRSQRRAYKIAYTPEAKCVTQFPFRYRDFFRQRRRWQIGMVQSMKQHGYMLANRHYGWVGILSGSLFVLYEMLAPFMEILGAATLVFAFAAGILNVPSTVIILFVYYILMLFMEWILVAALNTYELEPMTWKKQTAIFLLSCVEFLSFHIINSAIKILAMLTYRKYSKTWQHIKRVHEPAAQK